MASPQQIRVDLLYLESVEQYTDTKGNVLLDMSPENLTAFLLEEWAKPPTFVREYVNTYERVDMSIDEAMNADSQRRYKTALRVLVLLEKSGKLW